MAKRRKYGDAWKDVQIDAEQNDAVFDRFFKRTPAPPPLEPELPLGEVSPDAAPHTPVETKPEKTTRRRVRPEATVRTLSQPHPQPAAGGDLDAYVQGVKQQYRLSKGEAAILKELLQAAGQGEQAECYAKVPQLAETCGMTHRGCQFALRNLQARGLILRVKEYDPADRLGIKFQILMPLA